MSQNPSLKKKSQTLAPWLGGLRFFVGIVISLGMHEHLHENQAQISRLPVPAPHLEHFHFGYRSNLADGIWLQVLQHMDHCSGAVDSSKEICRSEAWLFQTLWSASLLDPGFRAVPAVGGLALSILIGDTTGATKLYDRAVKLFPDDWPILYRAAYHALEEQKEPLKAAALLRAAAQNGAPPWVQSLAGKIYLEEGRMEMYFQFLQQLKASNVDPEILQRLESRLQKKLTK